MVVAVFLAIDCLCFSPASGAEPTPSLTLLKAADFRDPKQFRKTWTHFSAEKESPFTKTWSVIGSDKDPILRCVGKPIGYIRTVAEYDDFELSLKWKYPTDKNGNSGILIYTSGKDKIWPTAIQIQLHTPVVGTVIPTGEAEIDAELPMKNLKLPVNVWHSCRIISENGKVTLFINNQRIGEVAGCKPKKGGIAFQSENSEIHFREIVLTPLEAPAEKKSKEKASTGG